MSTNQTSRLMCNLSTQVSIGNLSFEVLFSHFLRESDHLKRGQRHFTYNLAMHHARRQGTKLMG